MKNWKIKLIAWLAAQILGPVSTQLKEMLTELINRLEEKANATTNPYDNIFVQLLKTILNIQ